MQSIFTSDSSTPAPSPRISGNDDPLLDAYSKAVVGGPAKEAGLEPGDLLVALDDFTVESVDDLHRRLTFDRTGKTVAVTILREGEIRNVSLIPTERPAN